MTITEALSCYLQKERYFDPDYGRTNEVLHTFKTLNEELDGVQLSFLKELLIDKSTTWPEKYFVADLLYLYPSFSRDLFGPLLEAAIHYKDPSFNGVFMIPCIHAFGQRSVVRRLCNRFDTGNLVVRLGVVSLMYWFNRPDDGRLHFRLSPLYKKVLNRVLNTDNLIELYYYKLYLPKDRTAYDVEDEVIIPLVFSKFKGVPEGATALEKAIERNTYLEEILYGQLGWERD